MIALHRTLDAAVLKPELSANEVKTAILSCLELETFSVCVRPCDLPLAQKLCADTATAVCVVLGFPHGNQLTASKVDEAGHYLKAGVDEIDMVANYGWIRSAQWDAFRDDITAVANLTRADGTPLKVIIETAQLSAMEIREATEQTIAAGADFVKTSTGFNGEGARSEDVRLMLETAAGRIKVKASGGIRDATTAQHFLAMGVHRLGVGWNSCAAICKGGPASESGGDY